MKSELLAKQDEEGTDISFWAAIVADMNNAMASVEEGLDELEAAGLKMPLDHPSLKDALVIVMAIEEIRDSTGPTVDRFLRYFDVR